MRALVLGAMGALLCAAACAAAPLDAAQLEAGFDALIPSELRRNEVAGAAVVVVQAGRIVFAKGYGLADVAAGTPVSPQETLFRLGSVSKLFTWEAVMQQVDQGRIDLDRDINPYLDFPVVGLGGRPITMRHLMTHTAGFEDRFQGLWTADGASAAQLRDYLAKNMPARIFAPGSVPAYSNYGAALAGHIVERVSGEPFADYVERHITGPLGMRHTTAQQPLSSALAPQMARGYERAGGAARPFEYMRTPAGGVSGSAADMGRFMVAQLRGGTLDGTRILSAARTAQMLTPQTGWPVDGNALTLGWLSMVESGPRTLGHDGATLYFQSVLNLYPDSDAGLFVALNSRGRRAGATLGRIVRHFTHHYLSAPARVAAPLLAATCPSGLDGPYLPTRRSETGMGFGAALALQLRVRCESGELSVSGPGMDDSKWRAVAPLAWGFDDRSQLRFRAGADGRWEASDGNPVNRYQQGRWYQDRRLFAALAGYAALALTVSALRGAWLACRARQLVAITAGGALAVAVLLLAAAGAGLAAVVALRTEWALQAWFDLALVALQLAGWLGIGWLLLWMRHGRSRTAWDWLGWSGGVVVAVIAWNMNMLAVGPTY